MLRAELGPLGGKYYGTEIELYENDCFLTTLTIWVMGDGSPSEREIELWAPDEFEACDSHYESALGYKVCKLIVDAINNA